MEESKEIGGETPNNPGEPGSPHANSISTKEPDTITPKQEIKNMEVHSHHSHHASRKNFGHYFYEFLMLFLAVFCGFLAEYKLEHVIERQKGIQYIHSLEEDLQIDTEKLTELVAYFEQKQSGLDSMLECIKGITSLSNSNGLYNYLKYTTDYADFLYTDRTMQQLKNAGGLRMIPDKESADRIVMYDAAIKRLLLTEELELNPNQQSLKKQTISILNLSSVPDIENKFSFGRFDDNLPLLRYDKYMLNEFYNEIWIMKRKVGLHIKNLVKAKSTAEQLLEFLKEKY